VNTAGRSTVKKRYCRLRATRRSWNPNSGVIGPIRSRW
jgi:hypothetical protein